MFFDSKFRQDTSVFVDKTFFYILDQKLYNIICRGILYRI